MHLSRRHWRRTRTPQGSAWVKASFTCPICGAPNVTGGLAFLLPLPLDLALLKIFRPWRMFVWCGISSPALSLGRTLSLLNLLCLSMRSVSIGTLFQGVFRRHGWTWICHCLPACIRLGTLCTHAGVDVDLLCLTKGWPRKDFSRFSFLWEPLKSTVGLRCYLHPKELFLLNGGDPEVCFGADLRLGLAGVGQCVSPLVGAWIFALVKRHLDVFLGSPAVCDPVHVASTLRNELCQKAERLWPKPIPAPATEDQDMLEVGLHDPSSGDSSILIRASPNATVANLVQAEAASRGAPTADIVVQACDSNDALSDQPLASTPNVWIGTQEQFQVPEQPQPVADIPLDFEMADTVDVNNAQPVVPVDPGRVRAPNVVGAQCDTLPAAFLGLDAVGLRKLMCPPAFTASMCLALRKRCIDCDVRTLLMNRQGSTWADDEVLFWLRMIASETPAEHGAYVVDPLLMTGMITVGRSENFAELLKCLPAVSTVITAFVHEEHWCPVVWRLDHDQVQCYSGQLSDAALLRLSAFHMHACASRSAVVDAIINRRVDFEVASACGAFVIAFVRHLLLCTDLPSSVAALTREADVTQLEFQTGLVGAVTRPWIWAAGSSLWKWGLETLLAEHGVPKEAMAERISMLVERIGEPELAKTMGCANPWRELKWLANKLVPPLQLIRPSELRHAIHEKSQTGHVGNRAHKKGKGKGGSKTSKQIDPSTLKIMPGAFQADGQDVAQLDLNKIDSRASGVLLLTLHAAAPYLQQGRAVSAGALAFLVVGHDVDFPATALPVERVTFPAVCSVNAEPVIVNASMVQVGSLQVQKAAVKTQFQVAAVDTVVAKVLVFRDQTQCAWEEVVSRPLKHIIDLLPILRRCQNEDCTGLCDSWHPASQCAVEDPIFETWHRQWLSLSFATTPAEKAELYTVHVRIPACIELQLQAFAGKAGVYVEPKSEDGRAPSSAYQVIWTPKSDFQTVMLQKQTMTQVIGVARMGMKYDLRCKVEDAQTLHTKLKPGNVFAIWQEVTVACRPISLRNFAAIGGGSFSQAGMDSPSHAVRACWTTTSWCDVQGSVSHGASSSNLLHGARWCQSRKLQRRLWLGPPRQSLWLPEVRLSLVMCCKSLTHGSRVVCQLFPCRLVTQFKIWKTRWSKRSWPNCQSRTWRLMKAALKAVCSSWSNRWRFCTRRSRVSRRLLQPRLRIRSNRCSSLLLRFRHDMIPWNRRFRTISPIFRNNWVSSCPNNNRCSMACFPSRWSSSNASWPRGHAVNDGARFDGCLSCWIGWVGWGTHHTVCHVLRLVAWLSGLHFVWHQWALDCLSSWVVVFRREDCCGVLIRYRGWCCLFGGLRLRSR